MFCAGDPLPSVTTWLLVTMCPSVSKMMPLPTPPVGAARPKISIVAPSVCTRTTDGASFLTMSTAERPVSSRIVAGFDELDAPSDDTAPVGGVEAAGVAVLLDEPPEHAAAAIRAIATSSGSTRGGRIYCMLWSQ